MGLDPLHSTGVRKSRSTALSARLALASLGTALAVGVVCAVGLSSLEHTAVVARVAVKQQLALIDDASAMSAFQYQKGFVAEYLLTGDRARLADIETTRPQFESWLASAHAKVSSPTLRRLLDDIEREYRAYDATRKRAVALRDAGRLDEAQDVLASNHARTQRLWELFGQFGRLAREDAERTLDEAEGNVKGLGRVLVGTSLAGALASLLAGFLWARKVTKPIYELEVQIESAAERTRIAVTPGRDGLDALGDQVSALVQKLEDTDSALAEHQRRLIQSEKLSAVGELAAKLAHEVLNPLAGMKAAIQLLVRQGAPAPGGPTVVETAEALNREITRVEGLVRRLVNYSRPLAPRVEVTPVGSVLDAAVEGAQTALARRGVTLARREEAGLPPVEVDPLLFSQALLNLLTNAAEATPAGGRVELAATRSLQRRDEVTIRVTDEGPGLTELQMSELFKPFFTTKPEGHGLGLAVSQNIVHEHGGTIAAANRGPGDGPGAAFEIRLPVIR
jgi:signal transduction histidine kinase